MARSRKSKKSRGSSGFSLFVLGVLVGAIGTALTYGVLIDRPSDIGSGIDSLIDVAKNRQNTVGNQAETSRPESESEPKVQFSYHEFLLEDEFLLPARKLLESTDEPAAESKPEVTQQASEPAAPVPAPEPSRYVLQVGSFNSFQEADAVKVNLALQGQQAFIQKVTVEGRGEFFRVRIGPFDTLQTAEERSAFLTGIGYPPLRFRIKG